MAARDQWEPEYSDGRRNRKILKEILRESCGKNPRRNSGTVTGRTHEKVIFFKEYGKCREKKTEEVTAVETKDDETGAAVEQAVEKPKRTRRKKTETAEEAPAKKTVRKTRVKKEVADTVEKIKETVTRKPRKKAVVPTVMIQNMADQTISYDDVVAKVQAAAEGIEITSLDIYVKAEEGKAYYVVNGDVTGDVDLF